MREFPSVRHVLGTLRTRYDLALLSGLLHDLLLADVRERGLESFFDVVEGGDKAGSLRRLRAAGRSVVLFVGDTSHDEAVAREAGIAFYHVTGVEDLRRLPEGSEEHTSELQSLAYLVCRLLLEKKQTATTQPQECETSR